jgi:hypothetical protein
MLGNYSISGQYGPSGYPFGSGGSYYGVSGALSGKRYASTPYGMGSYGSYAPSWPYTTP